MFDEYTKAADVSSVDQKTICRVFCIYPPALDAGSTLVVLRVLYTVLLQSYLLEYC